MPRAEQLPGPSGDILGLPGPVLETNETDEAEPRGINYARGHETNAVVIEENEKLKNRERFLALKKRQAEIAAELKSLGVTITEDPKFAALSQAFLDKTAPAPAAPAGSIKSTDVVEVIPPTPVEPKTKSESEPTEPESDAEPESEAIPELSPVTPAEVASNAIKNRNFGTYISGIVKKHARGIIAGLALTLGVTGLGAFLTPKNTKAANVGGGFLTEDSATINKSALEQSIQDAIANPDQASIVINDADVSASLAKSSAATEVTKDTNVAGETINGVKYDYSEYNDRANKTSKNAYGYDYSDQYGNRSEATKGILHMASTEPEALASYAYDLLTSSEKQELGIDGLTMVQIDNKFDQAGGGDLQNKILDKITQILQDQDNTEFKFYHENGTENTHYIYFVDDNGDGTLTPDELHIGYDVKKRNNAPQVDVYRTIKNADGTSTSKKMIDLNMYCGYQPNYVKAPVGVKHVPTAETAVTNVTPAPVITGGGIVPPTTVTPPTVTPPPVTPPPITPPNITPTPTPPPPTPTPPPPTPTPTPEIPESKNAENLTRIDDKIKEDIENNIHTGELVIPKTEDVTKVEEKTDKPTGDAYQGTEATTTENQASEAAETPTNISTENNASENQGGANAGNAEDNPVAEDNESQAQADANEISQSEAPQSTAEAQGDLADLGIS